MIPKFRAWEKNMNAMIPVENIDFLAKQINTNSAWRMFHEIELMQYTGLKDKNGVEIYEGDIVHWMKEFISPMDMRTKHKIDGNRKVYQKESGEWVMGQGNGLHREVENIEVIGNIYENPELEELEE